MREKVTIPERVAGYLHRAALMERMLPTDRRSTVLKAPGGFGKTTLLSECCRHAREAGTVAAWLTLDVQDTPYVLEAYLAFACREAGLDPLRGTGGQDTGDGVEGLLRAVAACGRPCLLALDELERIAEAESVELVNTLLKWAPENLSIAIACREFPAALDIGSSVLAGDTALFDASHLRFSRAEIASFLGGRLPGRDIDALARRSAGWPIALRIAHNQPSSTEPPAPHARDVAENWIESRLWRGLAADDREFLLDVGLFERLDASLLDEVLEGNDLMERLRSMPVVAGLLESVRVDGSGRWRLHPLIREHCDGRRRQENPGRSRALHRGIAAALARRGETVLAMHHAVRADAPELAARILEHAGAMRLWLREGIGRLQSAARLLTPAMTASHPRLALARCVVEMTNGRVAEARRTYHDALASRPAPDAGDAFDFEVDAATVRGMLCLYGCESANSEFWKETLDDLERFADEPLLDPATRASFEIGLGIAHNLTARFDAALDWVNRAERRVGESRYIRMFNDLYRGQIALARGQPAEAARCYAGARRIARERLLQEPGQATFVEVMMRELELETHRAARLERAAIGIPETLYSVGTPLATFAAASAASAELTLLRKGSGAAVRVLDEAYEYALDAHLPALVRCLGGMRTHYLAAAGRIDEAQDAWRRAGLPEDDARCLDLDGQSWREFESLTCARLQLLRATGRFDAGRRLADALFAVAAQRGLRRTWMRALALTVALERDAGAAQRCQDHLAAFLRLYAEADYAAGAVRERSVFVPALEELLREGLDAAVREPGERLLKLIGGLARTPPQDAQFTARELQILECLDTLHDKEIARALELSVPGVRYHVARIFAKLGVHDRHSAVDRARRAGLLLAPPVV